MVRTAFIVCSLVAAAAVQAQQVSFLLRPELNKPYRYEIKMASSQMDTPQGSFSLKVELMTSATYSSVTPEALVSKQKMESLKVMLNDNPLPIPEDPNMTREMEVTQKPTGELISRKGGEAAAMQESPRFAMMTALVLPSQPVQVGESWTRDIKGDPAKKTVDARAKMTFEKQEMFSGILANRVAIAYSELAGDRPMGMVGTAWMEASTGMLLKMEATMNDVSMNEMMPPMNMTFVMTQVR